MGCTQLGLEGRVGVPQQMAAEKGTPGRRRCQQQVTTWLVGEQHTIRSHRSRRVPRGPASDRPERGCGAASAEPRGWDFIRPLWEGRQPRGFQLTGDVCPWEPCGGWDGEWAQLASHSRNCSRPPFRE